VRFSAFGRQWHWRVSPNTHLLASLPRTQKTALSADTSLWQGQGISHPGHWLRFSVWNNAKTGLREIHGMWWDGLDFYVIEPAHATPLAERLEKAGVPASGLVTYRLSDVRWNRPLACGTGDEENDFSRDYDMLFAEMRSGLKSSQDSQAATLQLNVAIVADTFYQNHWGSNTSSSILNLMNNVDGIYSNQIGVTLNLSQLLMLNDNGPMTATDSAVLLPQFRDWVGAGNLVNPGLAHLFTSRNLDGNIKGRAYLNVLCGGQWGTGIDEVVGNSYETIIVAHEMGHNFGADHDGDANGSCPNEPPNTYIMSPTVSASYTNFSACSVNVLTTSAGVASCLVPVGSDLIFAHGFE